MYRYVWFLSLFAAPALAGEHTYYLHVINNTADGITSLAVAESGSSSKATPIAIRLLQGGGDSSSVQFRVASGDCLRDLQWTFTNGDVFVQRNVDVCHDQRYRINSATKRQQASTLTQR